MHIRIYAGLFKVNVSLILCTDTKFLLKIFEDIDIGSDVIFNHLFY